MQVLTDSDYTRAVDWWGLGVLIFEVRGRIGAMGCGSQKRQTDRQRDRQTQMVSEREREPLIRLNLERESNCGW